MAKTMLDQIATNRALYNAARGGKRMGDVPAGKALMSAMMIERQRANADGYYAGGSYGSFIGDSDEKRALDAALILQEGSVAKGTTGQDVQNSGRSYSYAGGSYGQFIDPAEQQSVEAMHVASVLDGGEGAGNQPNHFQGLETEPLKSGFKSFLQKYKLWIIAIVAAVAAYFVWRKK